MSRQRMVRKQVYIEPEHDALLKDFARRWRVTEAEVLRHAIGLLKQAAPPDAVRLRAWEEIKALAAERRKLGASVPQTGRDWKRDDLYTGPRFDKWGPPMEEDRTPDTSIADR